jgi:hypothetical protein
MTTIKARRQANGSIRYTATVRKRTGKAGRRPFAKVADRPPAVSASSTFMFR